MRILTILVLIALGMLSCKSSMLKEVKEKDENGKMQSLYFIHKESQKKHGAYLAYNEDGSLYEKSNFNQGKLDGLRTLYHPNGKPKIEEPYTMGELNGTYKSYHENGALQFQANYSNNVMGGLVTSYFDSGKVKEEVTFVDNEENGPFVEYFENGQKMWEGNYHNGDNELGLLMKYDSTGTLIRKLECDSLYRCQTIWTIEDGDQEKIDVDKMRR